MKFVQLNYDPQQSGVERQALQQAETTLKSEIERVSAALKTGYTTGYASINLPSDAQMRVHVKKLIKEKQKTIKPTMLVVVGIGGSNLGTIAVHEVVNGLLYNERNPHVSLFFVDTVDPVYTQHVIERVRQECAQGGSVLVNVVSKSGTTPETIVNFELFLQVLQECVPKNYTDHVVVTTDRGSKLWDYAQQENMTTLEIPQRVGGRYSVLSPVGLFPLGMIGVDIDQLHAGAQDAVVQCANPTLQDNPAALSAAIIYTQHMQGSVIHDTFLFSRQLHGLGDWYRQLVGESLGKKVNLAGSLVHAGITPTTSVGSNDLHSVAQLYLGGPRDKFTTFVTVGQWSADPVVPNFQKFESIVPNIQQKKLSSIMAAIVQGTQHAYTADKRPFVSVVLKGLSERAVGQYMQFKMMEVIYLAQLMDVNPFDQPNVELYKQKTKELLAG